MGKSRMHTGRRKEQGRLADGRCGASCTSQSTHWFQCHSSAQPSNQSSRPRWATESKATILTLCEWVKLLQNCPPPTLSPSNLHKHHFRTRLPSCFYRFPVLGTLHHMEEASSMIPLGGTELWQREYTIHSAWFNASPPCKLQTAQ